MKVLNGSRSSLLRPLSSCLLWPLLLTIGAFAGQPPIDTSNPESFFTNVASRLLRAELNLDLGHIQIHPTNHYTPVVHRLLQLTANLYDATTNRTATGYPFLPSVFRPLFRRDSSGEVFIAGYREVTDDGLAHNATAPPLLDVESGEAVNAIPPIGTLFGPDRLEPLVWNVPLIIGAKKGFPNFNEFAMQSGIFVTRLLEFRRDPALPMSPVVETNQMYLVMVTNSFGLEAWNPYTNVYPRNLELTAVAEMRMTLTNQEGTLLYSNTIARATVSQIQAGSWPGNALPGSTSFILPLPATNGGVFLPYSTYRNAPPWFVPVTRLFERGFYDPQFMLCQKDRLRFLLVDTEARRIVDYVTIQKSEPVLNIVAKLNEGGDCSTITQTSYQNPGNLWCTNRLRGSTNLNAPTYGVMNQIMVCLNGNVYDWSSYALDPTVGQDIYKAVDAFRVNLGLSPRFNTGTLFYKSNVFYAPLTPYRPIYVHTSWQANDPLMHRTIGDLTDLTSDDTNRVNFAPHNPPLDNLGLLNVRYDPWGGNPLAHSNPDIGRFELGAKDPAIERADDWNGAVSQPLNPGWIGNVHRGTPWQTVFLKSTNAFESPSRWRAWQNWTGVSDPYEARALMPTNDWRIASLVLSWFNTNHPGALWSVNQKSTAEWSAILHGLTALTNSGDSQVEPVVISSNSPQAALIADGLLRTRAAQPGQVFHSVGDICATPELSVASPWINTSNSAITDASLEILPAQLLMLLRPDSAGAISLSSGGVQVQFTGFDGYSYALESSTNLLDWRAVGTYYPSNGFFRTGEIPSGESRQYYRSTLLP